MLELNPESRKRLLQFLQESADGVRQRESARQFAMDFYKPSWVDLAIVVVLIVGMVRGRKRGISEELLDVFKWLVIIVAASYLYEPIGAFMAEMTPFSLLSCYITTYAAIMGGIFLLFSAFKRAVGSKLVESDAFGASEYYLGILAGFVRYACILVVVFSFLNARQYQPHEITANRKVQMDNYGMMLWSGASLQQSIFQESLLGNLTHQYLHVVMIRPTPTEQKRLGNNGRSIRAKERRMNDILN